LHRHLNLTQNALILFIKTNLTLETDISSGLEQKITQLIRNSILSGEIRQGTHLVEAVFANKYDVSHGTIRTALRDLVKILVDASVTSSVIMFIVVFAGMFSWAASVIGVVDKVANAIIEISPNAVVMIILVNILLLGLGMILDAISISYLVMPILIPVLVAFHIDPLWYGVIFISAMAIGQATPPVGVNLFTAANLIKGDVDSVAKEAIPYVIMDIIVLIILSLLPILSLYLPIRAGLYTP